MDACLRHIDLVLSHRGDGGKYLPVHIREADTVVIDDVYSPDTAPREHFNDIAANASDAEDSNP